MIGGIAMSVVKKDILTLNTAEVGDMLLLTKPLGT
jgi:selenophosphate synthase